MATGSPNILREFLVAIGFSIDDQEFRDFQSKFNLTTQKFAELGKVAAAAGVAIAATVIKTASEMERLYFVSERTGASVGRLMSLRFGAGQAGINAETITGAVESMAASLRANPGLAMFFQQLGIKQVSDNTQNLIDLVTRLKDLGPPGSYGYAIAQQIAAGFGLDPQTLFMLEKNLPQILHAQQQFREAAARSGINIDKISAQSHDFMNDVRQLMMSVELLGISFEGRLLPFADSVVKLLQSAVNFAIELNSETKGWSTALGGIAITVAGIVGSFAALRGIAGFLGLGARAGAGATAGGAAAGAAEGAGGLGLGTAAAVGGLVIGDALLLWHDIKEGHKLFNTYKESGVFSNIGNSVSGFISKFEGFSRTAYRDAGHMSIGYGHQIRNGEDFAGGVTQARALQLLAQDTANAQAAVMNLVRTHLNANQLAALTDLVYNIGSNAFTKSTLLRDLNAGDFAGAAGQFSRFNKVLTPRGYVASADLSARRASERDLFTRQVSLSQKTEINVHGGGDPREAARQVERSQKQVNADLVRDMAGSVQ